MQPATLPPPVNNRKDARHEEKRGEGSDQQPADDGAAERSVLLAAFTETDGHGHHANDHG